MNIQINKKSRCPSLKTLRNKDVDHNYPSKCPNQMSDVRTYFGHLALKLDSIWSYRQMSEGRPKVKMIQTSGNWEMGLTQIWTSLIQMSEVLKKWFFKNQMSDSLNLYLQGFNP
jgi:hypothetical protein